MNNLSKASRGVNLIVGGETIMNGGKAMSEITFESVLIQARQLPWLERQRQLKALAEEPEADRKKPHPKRVPWKDRSREYQWLRDHAREYVGQWVALEGDQLVASGATAVEVLD